MNEDEIRDRYQMLSSELKSALSTMELTDRIIKIRSEIHDLQLLCPHNAGSYDYSQSDECPYCGKKFRK